MEELIEINGEVVRCRKYSVQRSVNAFCLANLMPAEEDAE